MILAVLIALFGVSTGLDAEKDTKLPAQEQKKPEWKRIRMDKPFVTCNGWVYDSKQHAYTNTNAGKYLVQYELTLHAGHADDIHMGALLDGKPVMGSNLDVRTDGLGVTTVMRSFILDVAPKKPLQFVIQASDDRIFADTRSGFAVTFTPHAETSNKKVTK